MQKNDPSAQAEADASGQRAEGSVVELVIQEIKTGLRGGAYAPGQRLVESDVCERTGASRSSVREAMRRLAAEGLVDIQMHKGARIRHLDLRETLDIYEVRGTLEGLAARLAARNIDQPTNRERLLRLERAFDASCDGGPSRYMQYNLAFHRLIVELANNRRLTAIIEQLELPAFLSLLHVIVDPPSAELSRSEHVPIVHAILAGDENAAGLAMQKHISRTAAYVRDHASKNLV